MNKEPKISVIVPVYKVEPYLRKCLDSIVGQTYQNLQIILVDDGSPDNCGLICDEYAAKDSRIQVIHQDNGGVSAARNAGLKLAAGDYIGWVDSDDWIELDMYEYLLDNALKYGADIVQCGLFWEEDNCSKQVFVQDKPRLVYGGIDKFLFADWRRFSNQIYNKLYKSDILKGVSFSEQYPVGEDLHFNLQILERAVNIMFVEEAKYHYVQRKTSLCHEFESVSKLVSLHSVLLYASEKFADNADARLYFQENILRDSLDICFKLVGFNINKKDDLLKDMQNELHKNLFAIMFRLDFSIKEKIKVFLIIYFWPVYEFLILRFRQC